VVPERQGPDVYFSVTEAARILGVSRQAVYAAISSGRLSATELGYGKKISASSLAVYGIQAGKSPPELFSQIQEVAKADESELLLWLLMGLGLFWLIKTFLKSE